MTIEEKTFQEIGKRLSEARSLINVYQADIAREYSDFSGLSFNQSVISCYENGTLRTGSIYLKFLAEKYNINANFILTGKGNLFSKVVTGDLVFTTLDEILEMEKDLLRISNKLLKLKGGRH
jgi:transcriptional regulator with XRE-family HTH domain